jgi:predicted  nucleic acid-binding Zn-ribbon protein
MDSERPTESGLSEDLAKEVAGLEFEIAELRSKEEEHDSAVVALSSEIETRRAELAALEGRLTLTRNARATHEQRLVERRASLKAALADDALRVFQEAMATREDVARQVAATAETLLDQIAAFESAREAAWEAFTTADACAAEVTKRLDPAMASEIEAVPEVLRDAWEKLVARVRRHIDAEFENELVDAAARSPLGHAIEDLPVHLRQLAKNRRSALGKEKRRAIT